MEMTYIYYLLIAAVVVIAAYAAMRSIDYGFGKREARNEFVYTEATDKRRYTMAKGCIQSYNQGQKQMAMSMVKELNDNLFEMAKKMGDL